MIKEVIFDMYETLITLFDSPVYFCTQMAEDAGIPKEDFQIRWRMTEEDRTTGNVTVDEVIGDILKANNCFTMEKMKTIMENIGMNVKTVFIWIRKIWIIWIVCSMRG